jgi:3-hydroxymyristoyl/3-hydroxydecanoyl-(acyl carrier protein) dehydratase
VIGGEKAQVQAAIARLACDAVFLNGVVSVHCDAAQPVAEAYRALHLFPTRTPAMIDFYSCALGRRHELTTDSAADSILKQALNGFDFTRVIETAYQDGIRLFIETGPHASVSRMIRSILSLDQPYLAEPACRRGEDGYFTVLKLIGNLMAEGVPIDPDLLYGNQAYGPHVSQPKPVRSGHEIVIVVGGRPMRPALARTQSHEPVAEADVELKGQPVQSEILTQPATAVKPPPLQSKELSAAASHHPSLQMMETLRQTQELTARAHHQFLELSSQIQQAFGETFHFQNALLARQNAISQAGNFSPPTAESRVEPAAGPGLFQPKPAIAFSRDMCLEFAVGSVARVLGPEFAVVDTYPARVRLPDKPLMLVDRMLSVEGEKCSLTSGRIITEHDVSPSAWYLTGDRAPVCISVEAGQADLFLCAYLGIDLRVKGQRTYRLLDAKVTFHRGLPRPGDTIRYEITIDKFIRQQETYLFFFRFEGYIGNEHLITMTDGCAGFFTPKEVANSGGIILTAEQTAPHPGKRPFDWQELTPLFNESYSDDQVEALRKGNLSRCFGPGFEGLVLAESLRLPSGRMRLLDRVLAFDPQGGRYGLGRILAEADIHPDDWFLTCHFVDDKVMPGTLMYECCAHALRIFLLRIGWVTDKPGAGYEPVIGLPARLKCRGPVTPKTRHVHYEVVIKEIGYNPEPYVVADAHMLADGEHIVDFEDMSMKMSGVSRQEIEALWQNKSRPAPCYARRQILEFAVGRPSAAFGAPYEIFDEKRVIARLPGPPYCFIDRITRIEPEAWVLKPDGWIEAQVDVPEDAWYFAADRSGIMPYCVLLEIALQPCGWLAAYLGSALHGENDLKFRNLGGSGVIHRNVLQEPQTLTMRTRLTKVSEAGEMIIENFDFEVLQGKSPIYTGDTYFGFFTEEALARQKGLALTDQNPWAGEDRLNLVFDDEPPLTPDDATVRFDMPSQGLGMPAKALRMLDEITAFALDGGPEGLGYVRGIKRVDPAEWFFKAHFYQDPVCPGSLGIESFLQLLKFYAKKRWPDLSADHGFELITDESHRWIYRGQIIPGNRMVTIDALIKKVQDSPQPVLLADGWVKVDGLYIYKMESFGLRLSRRKPH